MEDYTRINDLIARYQAGTCTETERALVDRVLFTLEEGETLSTESLRRKDDVWAALQTVISEDRPVRRLPRLLPYAAAVIFLLTIGAWFVVNRWLDTGDQTLVSTEVLPGGNRATLTLANGQTITLDEAQAGIVIGEEDITYADGAAIDMISSEARGRRNNSLLELTTPNGGTYQIILPDGSKVWLNAASTLKYPSRFTGDSREVFLEGEAFFEIKGIEGARVSRVPFKVQTSGQTVEVLGTEFNISAYADETETKTTLVEGRVKVAISPLEGGRGGQRDGRGVTRELKPGTQSIVRNAAITVSEVDVSAFTAWRDGTFRFDDTPLIDIMRQVSRWYDVEVDYSQLPDKRISGIVSRGERLSAVLRALEISSQLTFELQERRLVLKKE